MRIPFVASLILSYAALAAAQSTAGTTAPWSYQGKTGPLVWGRLDPAYRSCSKGHEQSPVDIRGAHLDKSLQPIQFHWIAGPVTLVNDGHTVMVQVDPGSYMLAGGVRYDLIQFHFHHPSEHAVKGRLADMEIHFVYKSADGKLAVVAVRLSEDRGFPNATLATLWEHLPTAAGSSQRITDMLDPGGMLPEDRGYWTYTGSLTTPPCTEGVRWFVFEQPVSISRSQLLAFTSIFRMNTRPLQELHGRRIEASE